jgi:hypothetical protein
MPWPCVPTLVPPSDRARWVEDIIAELEQRDWQQTPGDVGHVYFIRARAEAGRSDILHRVYSRQAKGSYGGALTTNTRNYPNWGMADVGACPSLRAVGGDAFGQAGLRGTRR